MSKFLDNPLLLVVLLVIIVLVFGANRLPGAARSLGRSMRIFKSEVKQMNDDDGPSRTDRDRPLEGRVVDDLDDRATRSTAEDETRRRGV